MIKIVIVDDHSLVRVALRRILSDIPEMKVIGEAADGADAIILCEKLKPDVVLMDIQMPGMDGFEATRQLRQLNSDIKILIVTSCENDVYLTRLLQIGAAGYITKNAETDEMVRAIQLVSTGQRYLTPEIASRLAIKKITAETPSPLSTLTNRELDVMRCITDGMSIAAIAEKLKLSSKTVNSHRYRIFEKLKVQNDVELTHVSMRYGLTQLDRIAAVEIQKKQPASAGELI